MQNRLQIEHLLFENSPARIRRTTISIVPQAVARIATWLPVPVRPMPSQILSTNSLSFYYVTGSNPSQCYPTTTSTTTPAPTLPTLPFTLPFTFTTPRFTIPRFTTPTFPTLPFTLPFTLSTQASTMSTTSSVFSCTTGGVFQIPGNRRSHQQCSNSEFADSFRRFFQGIVDQITTLAVQPE